MKMTIKRWDGNVWELDGTPDELAAFVKSLDVNLYSSATLPNPVWPIWIGNPTISTPAAPDIVITY